MTRDWMAMKLLRKNGDGLWGRGPAEGGKTRRASIILAPICLAMIVLSGCAAQRLRVDYKGYESMYAESSNRQLLLNLARLNQHHPTYFFKLGPISTTYRIQGTATASGSQVAGLYTNILNKNVT